MLKIFRHYVPIHIAVLGMVEAIILLAGFYFALQLGDIGLNPRDISIIDSESAIRGSEPVISGSVPVLALAFVSAVMLMAMIAMGLYERDLRVSASGMTFRVMLGLGTGAMVLVMLTHIQPTLVPDENFLWIWLTGICAVLLPVRFALLQLLDLEPFRRNVLVLGAGRSARDIADLKRKSDWRGMSLVGFVPFGNDHCEMETRLITTQKSIVDLAIELKINELVVALDDWRQSLPVNDMLKCKLLGIKVVDATDFLERQTGRIAVESLRPSSVFFSQGFSTNTFKSFLKRILDISAALLILVATLPIMILTGLAIRAESNPGDPILYRQTRVGKGERNFELLKFRSMRLDAEKDGLARWSTLNDDRVTRVGRFIRRTRIDELPQLLNVLFNQMSLVGPRPERPQFVEKLKETTPYYSLRHHVNPGITGWAQVRYPYGSSEKDAKEKLQYDLYYIKNQSFFLDVMILLQTAHVVLWGKGGR